MEESGVPRPVSGCDWGWDFAARLGATGRLDATAGRELTKNPLGPLVVGLDLEEAAEGRGRTLPVLFLQPQPGELAPHLGREGARLERLLEVGLGLGEMPQFLLGGGKLGQRLPGRGPDLERPSQCRGCLLELVLFVEDLTQLDPTAVVLGVGFHHPAEQLFGGLICSRFSARLAI